MKRITQIIFISLAMMATQLKSQQLVTDLTPFAIGSSPNFVQSSANYLVFTANSKEFGTALFVTDSTEGSTRLIKALPMDNSSKFIDVVVFDTTCYFVYGYGSQFGLWKTSLNTPNAILLTTREYPPALFTQLGNSIYFRSSSGGGVQLWRTDGTVAGTTALFNLPAYPQKMSAANNVLFFLSDDKLWKSDATLGGTVMVKKFDVLYSGRPFTTFKNSLFFTMQDSLSGTELWKSDGTTQGTQLVKDIYRGVNGSSPFYLTVAGDYMYFTATDSAKGRELFRTDGTAQGTQLVKDIHTNYSSEPRSLIAHNNDVYFRAMDTNNNYGFWKSDGTEQGTIKLKGTLVEPSVYNSVYEVGISTGNSVLFNAMDNIRGEELWKTDGTLVGTALVKDIFPGISSSSINKISFFKNKVYFSANDSLNGSELWRSDGTLSGTKIFAKLNPTPVSSLPSQINVVNNQLYFTAYNSFYGNELMKSDGTKSGTGLVKDIFPGIKGSSISTLRVFGNKLIFNATASDFGLSGYWISDGTDVGTKKILTASSGDIFDISQVEIFKNKLFLDAGRLTAADIELWTSDGTNAGTKIVKDINPTGASYPKFSNKNATINDSLLFFVANDGVNGYELWKTTGTTQGTAMVADIYPNDPRFFPPEHIGQIIVVGNFVYFSANNNVNGSELWKSDGTTTGTTLLKDINLGSTSSNISNTTNFKNILFFSATNGASGLELWKSDGTANGTTIVKDIVTGSEGSEPDGLTVHKNELFFVCKKDSTNTDALWKTDGTTNGTVRVKRLFPNGLSNIKNMFSTDTYLYFSATNGVNGTELWRTNGTDTGTVMVFDLNVGAASSNPDNFTFYKNDLFFVADNGTTGRELWRLTSSPNVSVKESATIDIVLFPNPTSEYLMIQQEETGTERSVSLYDNAGKLVINNVSLKTSNTQIDVHHLPSGLYFLEVREKNTAKNALKKVIITR